MKHILVIDDSPTIRMAVDFATRELGFGLVQAENGAEALTKLAALKQAGNDLALCITDINMPHMNGLEFIKEFRKTDRFTPVLVLTTENEGTILNEGKALGASAWIVKPFQKEDLLAVIKKLVR